PISPYCAGIFWRSAGTVLQNGRANLTGAFLSRRLLSPEVATRKIGRSKPRSTPSGEKQCPTVYRPCCLAISTMCSASLERPVAAIGDIFHEDAVFYDLSLSETYALKYWWCSPPRTGIASGRPTVWTARGIGASLCSDRCVRASL